ncbi:MAG TPA: hypothetical protein VK662_06005 [Acidothermaceae bacterium]|jgi:hypothetical protein|nr:hypothetical protein [Acidothermaceae bacterium]
MAEDSGTEGRLHAELAASAVPDSVRRAFGGTPPDPAAGQIWRACWDDVVELVVVLGVDGLDLAVAPVSLDRTYADDTTVVLSAEVTSLGVALAVWAGLERRVQMRVLDRFAGLVNLDFADDGWARYAVESGLAEFGSRPGNATDPLWEYRAIIEDEMDQLVAAAWSQGTGELAGLLVSSGLTVTALAETLSVPLPSALGIWRGVSVVTQVQAGRLSAGLGVPASDIMSANPALPTSLLVRMSHPRRRAQVRRLSAHRRVSEAQAWAVAGYETYALAARQTGETAEPAWDERIDTYFHTVLSDST